MIALRVAAAAAMICALAATAAAQGATPSSGTSGPATPPKTNLDDASGSLSSKLNQTGGVIVPKGDVDPSIHKPAPATGTMPVIKPGQNGTGDGG